MRETRKFLLLCLTVSAVFLLIAVSAASSETPTANTGSVEGVVRGMVINDGNVYYTRLKDAGITVEFSGGKALTGSDGRFLLSKIPSGERVLEIRHGDRSVVRKPVTVKTGKIVDVGYIPVFLGRDQQLPIVRSGSLIASFIESVETSRGDVKPVFQQTIYGDSPRNRLIFYNPHSTSAFLEVVLDETPVRVCVDKTGQYIAVTTRRPGLQIWDLRQMKLVKRIPLEGTPSDIRAGEENSRFYVSYFNRKSSGILMVDPASGKVIRDLKPGVDGMFTTARPLSPQNFILGMVNCLTGGHLALYDSQKNRITMLPDVGEMPIDLLYLKDPNRILVSNHLGKNITIVNADTLEISGIQLLEGTPGRIAASPDGASVYVTLAEKNQVIVLDSRTGQPRGKIPVGNKPFELKQSGKYLYVCNRQDGNISVIDTATNKVIRSTPQEGCATAQSVEVVP